MEKRHKLNKERKEERRRIYMCLEQSREAHERAIDTLRERPLEHQNQK